jgi:hypothetical protein
LSLIEIQCYEARMSSLLDSFGITKFTRTWMLFVFGASIGWSRTSFSIGTIEQSTEPCDSSLKEREALAIRSNRFTDSRNRLEDPALLKTLSMKSFLTSFRKRVDQALESPENLEASVVLSRLSKTLGRAHRTIVDYQDLYLPIKGAVADLARVVDVQLSAAKTNIKNRDDLNDLFAFSLEMTDRFQRLFTPELVLRALTDWKNLNEDGDPAILAAGAVQAIGRLEDLVRYLAASDRGARRSELNNLDDLFDRAIHAAGRVSPIQIAANLWIDKDPIEAHRLAQAEYQFTAVSEPAAQGVLRGREMILRNDIRRHRAQNEILLGGRIDERASYTRLKELTRALLSRYRNDPIPD